MSLITRCPACATQFKIVPDQLKLSDGWVRCGHCSDVFDATRYLESRVPGAIQSKHSGARQAPPSLGRDPSAPPSVDVVSSTPMDVAVPSGQAVQEEMAFALSLQRGSTALQSDDLDMDLTLDGPSPSLATDQTQPGGVDRFIPTPRLDQATTQEANREKENAANFHSELQRFAAGQVKPPETARAVIPAGPAAPPTASPPAPPAPTAPTAPTAADAVQQSNEDVAQLRDVQQGEAAALEPGFVRQARQRAFWRSPGVRGLLAVVVLLLSALLAVQWALLERDRLAARYPDLQPLLASLCEPLGCTIGAVRDLQAVVIDSATLTRRLGDFYAFDLVLKNTSAMALAVPALELSLTDTANTVISRRVYLPGELPGVPPLLPPQATVSVSLRLSLAVGNELPMAGYRALVFYP
jgi:predicted Zn finger-like uncharacterized protein